MNNEIKAILIDDEAKARNILKWMLEKYCPQVEILALADSVKDAQKKITQLAPNLIFLDVELTDGTGFDLLRQLNRTDFEVIFVTAYDHYALQAIKYHAFDYLLKPLDIEELTMAINKVISQLKRKMDTERLEKLLSNLQNQNSDDQQIAIVRHDGREFVPIQQIIRCEADGACTWLYLEGGRKILSTKNLGEYEKILPGIDSQLRNYFFRIHYSHIINMSQIAKYIRREKAVEMKGDELKIAIAQRRASQFVELLKQQDLL